MENRQEHTSELTAELTSVRFAQVARQLNIEAKRHGLRTPAFRSPPRVAGVTRSIRRRADGSATVSVALRGRPAVAVVADMIDGVLAANEHSTRLVPVRDRLWSAATPLLMEQPLAPVATVSPKQAPREGRPPARRAA